MKKIEIKNYKNIKNAVFNLERINFLVGDNNTGKSSILKIIDFFSGNDNLFLENTFFNEHSYEEIAFNKTKPITLFYLDLHCSKENKNEKKILEKRNAFELLKINEIKGTNNIFIEELLTLSFLKDTLVKFILDYECGNEFNYSKIKSITIKELKIENLENDLKKFISDDNEYISDYLDNLFLKNKLLIKEEKLNLTNINKEEKLFKNRNKGSISEFESIIKVFNNYNYNLYGNISTLYRIYIFLFKYIEDKDFENSYLLEKLGLINENRILRPKNYEVLHVNELRNKIESTYEFKELFKVSNNVNFWGKNNDKDLNEYIILCMYRDKEIKENIKNFYKNSNMLESIDIILDSNNQLNHLNKSNKKVLLRPIYQKYKDQIWYELKNTGAGISQSLSFLGILSMPVNKLSKFISIEQPELHLHPKAQFLLGNEIYKWLFNKDNNIKQINNSILFIETHSLHIIDGLRFSIGTNNKEPKVAIFYFNNSNENSEVSINKIKITKRGKFEGNTDNFLDFFKTSTIKLLGL